MAPSFADICTQADMRRFALCFLHTIDPSKSVDWAAAAADYDPNVKPESFKTVTTKAINRVKKAGAEGGDSAAAATNGAGIKGKGKGAGKKRTATEAENGEDEARTPPPAKKTKATGGKRGKKTKEADTEVKAEESVEGNELS